MDYISSFRGEHFFLSNFYPSSFVFNENRFENAEAAFQSEKCPQRRCEFAGLNPSEAKRLGQKVKLRPDWEDIKYEVMYAVCMAKFEQNTELTNKLLDTKDAILVEGNTWGDKTWGVCDGVGDNKLGKILMRVRTELAARR